MPGALPPRGLIDWSGARWLRNLVRNASPSQSSVVTAGIVGSTQLVNDRRYTSSRETDPMFSSISTATGVGGEFSTWGFQSAALSHGLAVRVIAFANTISVSRAAIPAGLTDLFTPGVGTQLINDEGAAQLIRAEAGSAAAVAGLTPLVIIGNFGAIPRPLQDAAYFALLPPGESIVFQSPTANVGRGCQMAVQAVRWL